MTEIYGFPTECNWCHETFPDWDAMRNHEVVCTLHPKWQLWPNTDWSDPRYGG